MGADDQHQTNNFNADTRDDKGVLRHPLREQSQSGQDDCPAREKKQKAGNLHGKRAHPVGSSNARLKMLALYDYHINAAGSKQRRS